MSEFKMEMSGFEELSRALRNLARDTGQKAMKRGMKRAAGLIWAQVLYNMSTMYKHPTGQTQSSTTLGSKSGRGNIGFAIRGDYTQRFVEFGHIIGQRPTTRAARLARERDPGRKFVAPVPVVSNAFESTKEQAIRFIIQDIDAEVRRAIGAK